jgi:4'-phosphopantetheinyl transferase
VNTAWKTVAEWPTLAPTDIHVWAVKLPAWRGTLDQCRAALPPEEIQRSKRFRQPLHRERDQLSRGILRQLLTKYLAREPLDFEFTIGAHGKPALRDSNLHFNISHSGDCAVFAFTRAGEVGVDIELLRDDMQRQREIATKYFSVREVEQLEALAEHERNTAFFRCWTRKEAYVKARGDGIFAGLQGFAVSIAPSDARLLHTADEGPWWMAALPEFSGYVGAVVVAASECDLSCWRLEPQFLFGNK